MGTVRVDLIEREIEERGEGGEGGGERRRGGGGGGGRER